MAHKKQFNSVEEVLTEYIPEYNEKDLPQEKIAQLLSASLLSNFRKRIQEIVGSSKSEGSREKA